MISKEKILMFFKKKYFVSYNVHIKGYPTPCAKHNIQVNVSVFKTFNIQDTQDLILKWYMDSVKPEDQVKTDDLIVNIVSICRI